MTGQDICVSLFRNKGFSSLALPDIVIIQFLFDWLRRPLPQQVLRRGVVLPQRHSPENNVEDDHDQDKEPQGGVVDDAGEWAVAAVGVLIVVLGVAALALAVGGRGADLSVPMTMCNVLVSSDTDRSIFRSTSREREKRISEVFIPIQSCDRRDDGVLQNGKDDHADAE